MLLILAGPEYGLHGSSFAGDKGPGELGRQCDLAPSIFDEARAIRIGEEHTVAALSAVRQQEIDLRFLAPALADSLLCMACELRGHRSGPR